MPLIYGRAHKGYPDNEKRFKVRPSSSADGWRAFIFLIYILIITKVREAGIKVNE